MVPPTLPSRLHLSAPKLTQQERALAMAAAPELTEEALAMAMAAAATKIAAARRGEVATPIPRRSQPAQRVAIVCLSYRRPSGLPAPSQRACCVSPPTAGLWTQSHHLIGGDAIPAIGGMSMLALPDRTHYILSDEGRLGDDRWLVLDRRSGEN